MIKMKTIPQARLRKMRTWTHGHGVAELETTSDLKEKISLLDLASNDYLALSKHPNLLVAATDIMGSEGLGAGGSRLVTGSRPIHKRMEKELAKWLDREHVLLFPSGFQANIAAVIALANRSTTVLADKLIHHSLLLGVKASGAKLQRYKHNDLNDLERLLILYQRKETTQTPIVLTESLFSMEGTSPNLKKMIKLCEKYKARLLVDEAHAIGILGDNGKGLCYGLKTKSIGIISGTFGKAFGSGGAFLASDKEMGEYLLQTSGAFRYTTALAPPLTAAALAALKLIKANPNWGRDLLNRASYWRSELVKNGWPCPAGSGQIISLEIGTDEDALYMQSKLEKAGFLCVAIRPPTVPEGTARLRLTLRRDLPHGTLTKLLTVLKRA